MVALDGRESHSVAVSVRNYNHLSSFCRWGVSSSGNRTDLMRRMCEYLKKRGRGTVYVAESSSVCRRVLSKTGVSCGTWRGSIFRNTCDPHGKIFIKQKRIRCKWKDDTPHRQKEVINDYNSARKPLRWLSHRPAPPSSGIFPAGTTYRGVHP